MRANFKKRLNFGDLFTNLRIFRLLYMVLITCEMLAVFDIVSLVLKSIILVWGFFLLINNFLTKRSIFSPKFKNLLYLFLVLMIITAVVNMSVWFVPNLVITYFTAICFFVFYGMYAYESHGQIEQEMIFVLKFFMYFSLVTGLISLVILLFKQEISLFGRDEALWNYYILGIFKNRLTGIYTNSNILAFSMIQGLVSCDMLSEPYIRQKMQKQIKKSVFFVCIAINLICLFLSDSNASFVFLIIYVTVRMFCNLFFKDKTYYLSKFIKSILVTLGFSVIIMSGSFALREHCQSFISNVMVDIYKHEDIFKRKFESKKDVILDMIDSKNAQKDPENTYDFGEKISDIHIGRENYEISSGRINLFKQGIVIFKHHPWLGIGRANLGLYGKKYLKNGLTHPDLHNGYLTILVSCGIIGFTIFAIFSFLVALDMCKFLFISVDFNYFGVFSRLFSVLVSYCAYCLFEKAILFDMTFMVGFFWSMLGYAVSYMYNKGVMKT